MSRRAGAAAGDGGRSGSCCTAVRWFHVKGPLVSVDLSPLLATHAVEHVANPRVARGRPIGPRERAVLSPEGLAAARAEIESWPGYAETPLRRLDGLAGAAGIMVGTLVVPIAAHDRIAAGA